MDSMTRTVSILALALVLAIARPARADSGARAAGDAERAEALFKEGIAAFEAQEFSEAYGALRTAWDLLPNYRTAAGLGQVELHLGQFVDAARHLSFCLRHFPADGDPEARRHVEQGFDEARGHVGALRIRVSVEGADVAVDGENVGRSPLDGLVFVPGGTHTVVASRSGYASATASVDSPVRATAEVRLSLSPAAVQGAPGASGGVSVDTGPRDSGEKGRPSGLMPSTWVWIIGSSLTAVGLGTAVVFDMKAAGHENRMREIRESIGGGLDSCVAPAPSVAALCRDLANKADDRERDAKWGTVAAVGTGAVAVATVITAVLLRSHETRSSGAGSLHLSLGASRGTASAFMSGAF